MRRAALGVALTGCLFGAGGCFDVHRVDPGALLIDDFDDGDYLPTDPQFGIWKCNSVNLSSLDYKCGRDSGSDTRGGYSLTLEFPIDDSPDQGQHLGEASLYTSTIDPQDFTGFNELVFDAKLISAYSTSLPKETSLYAELLCDGAPTADGSVPGNLLVVQMIPFDSGWQPFTLPMAKFGPASWIPDSLGEGRRRVSDR